MPYLHRSLNLLVGLALAGVVAQTHALTVDLGAASNFSAVTFGNFTGLSGDTGSLLAVGGDASLTNWQVNANNMPLYGGRSLIVGGNFTGTDGGVVGSSFIGGTSTTSSFGLGSSPSIGAGTAASPFDFAALQGQLQGTSAAAAAATPTGSVTYAGGSTQLTGTGSAVEVFAIDGAELSADSFLQSLSGINSDATVIFNVSGSSINLASFGFDLAGGSLQLNLLFNFYEATSLSFANMAIEGAVLAPYAAVTGTSGHIGGTFVAQSFDSGEVGNFEFHDINFIPVEVPTSAVPEPSPWMLLAGGLMACAFVSRRRRSDADAASLS
ncbi:MAG: choice-of-anchor A family protein [Burkholderiales bacterium]